MAITAATSEQFDAFLTTYGYTVEVGEKARLLALSLSFLSTIELCADGETDQAQCFIAYAMSAKGGGFNPVAVADDKTLTKKGIGRSAVLKEWEVNDDLSGTDSLSMLKRIPMAYGLLKPLLCVGSSGDAANFELVR